MKKRLISIVICLCMLLPMIPFSATAAEAPVQVFVVGSQDYTASAEAVEMINNERYSQQIPVMHHSYELNNLAMQRAAEVALWYSHSDPTRPDGSAASTIFDGLFPDGTITETFVSIGPNSAQEAFADWMQHTDTGDILLSDTFYQIGVGCFISNGATYWVVLLSSYDYCNIAGGDRIDTDPVAVDILPSRLNIITPDPEVAIRAGQSRVVTFYAENMGIQGSRSALYPASMEYVDPAVQDLVIVLTDYHGGITITGKEVVESDIIVRLWEDDPEGFTLHVNVFTEDNAEYAGTWGDNLTWTLNEGTLTISGEGPMDEEVYAETYFPWYLYHDRIVHLVIEEGVTTISESAFSYYKSLETVQLPNTMEYIGYRAFSTCEALNEINLPDSITGFGDDVFGSCKSLKSVQLPANLTHISGSMFSYSGLETIVIPDSVTTIGGSAFLKCEALINVTLPKGLTDLGNRSFSCCTSLRSISLPDGITAIPNSAFSDSGLTAIEIPDSVTAIGENAFSGCSSLASVILPDSIVEIDDRAFGSCTSLTTVDLPDGLTSISWSLFSGSGLVELEIPEGVTVINYYAFSDCKNLEALLIPSSVVGISGHVFEGCDNLTIYTYNLTFAHLYAAEVGIPYGILEDKPDTVYHPIHLYTNNYGDIISIPEASPANRYVLVEVMPDEGCYLDTLAYGYDSEEELDLQFEWISETQLVFFMPDCAVAIQATFISTKSSFTDVKESDYFYEPVLWAVSTGITSGTGNGRFSPNMNCSRGQVVTFLWRAAGEPEPVTTENPFTDIKPTDYYYKAVLWAVENGITSGTGNGKFSPNMNCTRAQVVTFLWRSAGAPVIMDYVDDFSDVQVEDYFYEAVRWAVHYGITSGTGNGKFSPNMNCTRGQVVSFLYRFLHG